MGLFSKTCGVCVTTIRGQYTYIQQSGKVLYYVCLNCLDKYNMITKNSGSFPTNPDEMRKTIKNGTNTNGIIEIRKRCNVCGGVFCYSDVDLARNRELLKQARDERVGAVLEAFGGTTVASNQNSARADALEAQIVDYSKCPKCNSTDLVEISAEEFTRINAENKNTVNNISAADEIKKYKELLDMGVISQEEFDAKKKQLLGL